MKRNGFLMGILSMVLVFGMALFVGCKNDDDDGGGNGDGGDDYLVGTWKPADGDPTLHLMRDKTWEIETTKTTSSREKNGDEWKVQTAPTGALTILLKNGGGNEWSFSFNKVSNTKIKILTDSITGFFVPPEDWPSGSGLGKEYEKVE
ncbi:MAG: hypothetical protein LBU17_10010 [Treponema sp.]|jgi:hypothetical protein|nr:hypothetical protein [Treponema sp.]